MLETRAHAEARGVQPLARIAGYGRRHEPSPDCTARRAQAIRQAIDAALAMAGADAGDVGHVGAHGLSTELDDRIEAQAIRATLGDVPVTAPKSFFGNIGAGGGALELAVSAAGPRARPHPADAQLRNARPQVPGQRRHRADARRNAASALAISHRTTGQAVALLVEAR